MTMIEKKDDKICGRYCGKHLGISKKAKYRKSVSHVNKDPSVCFCQFNRRKIYLVLLIFSVNYKYPWRKK